MIIIDSSADSIKIKLALLVISAAATLTALMGQFFHAGTIEIKLISLLVQCFALRYAVMRFKGKDASFSYVTVEGDLDRPFIHIYDLVMLLPSIFTLIFYIHSFFN